MLTPDQIQDLRGMLTEACDLHIADGGTIISGRFQVPTHPKQCCPMQCLVGDGMMAKTVAHLLGVECNVQLSDEVWELIHAFDNAPDYPASLSAMAALGHELRTMYIR
jgi:hypothetical protein